MKLLINAKIFPYIHSKSILIKNNKIKFIGDLDDINISSKLLDIIDCNNNSVLPGFIEKDRNYTGIEDNLTEDEQKCVHFVYFE